MESPSVKPARPGRASKPARAAEPTASGAPASTRTPARASADRTSAGTRPSRSWRDRLLGPVTGRAGIAAFVAGLLAVPCGVVLAEVSTGTDRLGQAADERLVAAGVALAVLGALAAWRGRGAVKALARRIATGVAVVLVAAFGVGIATGPVVIDGQVFLSTSTTARAFELAGQMRADLYRISELDQLAAYGQEDARAHVDAYPAAVSELVRLNSDYGVLAASAPSAAFAEAIGQLRVAAYWESEALKAKADLVVENDAKLTTDVSSYRNTAWTASLMAANQLEAAAQDFGFTLTADQTGPHE